MSTTHPDFRTVKESRLLTAYLGVELKVNYHSPLPGRRDSNPSFNVFLGHNGNQIWKDQGGSGSGSCGDIIKLHCLLTGCDRDTACRQLMAWDGASTMHQVTTSTTAQAHRITHSGESNGGSSASHTSAYTLTTEPGVRSFRAVEQSNYMRLNSPLPFPAWISEQLGVFVDTRGNLCIPTFRGGIHLKGGLIKGSDRTWASWIGAAGFSFCGNVDSTEWIIVEGLGDLLAIVNMLDIDPNRYCCMILNSLSSLPKAIEYLEGKKITDVMALLDKDKESDLATARLKKVYPFPITMDCRNMISFGKDIKDTWMEENRRKSAA